MSGMLEVAVIDDAAAAEATLDPMRSRLLAELAEPASAAGLAARLGLPRQKVNYHLRTLEGHGLIELAEERKRGNLTERVMRATATAYVISPAAMPRLQPDPSRAPDQLSARWLVALAARTVRDVGELMARAAGAKQRVATYAIDAEVRFATAADRAAFAAELTETVTRLVSRYHAADGREHRVVVALHPTIPTEES
jgi:DNA-binding transcriptional ArsR family regulator